MLDGVEWFDVSNEEFESKTRSPDGKYGSLLIDECDLIQEWREFWRVVGTSSWQENAVNLCHIKVFYIVVGYLYTSGSPCFQPFNIGCGNVIVRSIERL